MSKKDKDKPVEPVDDGSTKEPEPKRCVMKSGDYIIHVLV